MKTDIYSRFWVVVQKRGPKEACWQMHAEVTRLYSLLLARAFSRQSKQLSTLSVALSVDAIFSFSRASLRLSGSRNISSPKVWQADVDWNCGKKLWMMFNIQPSKLIKYCTCRLHVSVQQLQPHHTHDIAFLILHWFHVCSFSVSGSTVTAPHRCSGRSTSWLKCGTNNP